MECRQENAVLSLTKELDRVGGGSAPASDEATLTSPDGGSADRQRTDPSVAGHPRRQHDLTGYHAAPATRQDLEFSDSDTHAPRAPPTDVQVMLVADLTLPIVHCFLYHVLNIF